jgi:hypothetical protein
MRKDGEVLKRGIFDLEARRKPQVFAADAGESMEIQSKLACNKVFSTKLRLPMKRSALFKSIRFEYATT